MHVDNKRALQHERAQLVQNVENMWKTIVLDIIVPMRHDRYQANLVESFRK